LSLAHCKNITDTSIIKITEWCPNFECLHVSHYHHNITIVSVTNIQPAITWSP
jgi:hypothetical protein